MYTRDNYLPFEIVDASTYLHGGLVHVPRDYREVLDTDTVVERPSFVRRVLAQSRAAVRGSATTARRLDDGIGRRVASAK